MRGRGERRRLPVIVHAAKTRSWLTRNVWVLSAVSFLQDTASELLYPLLPIYLTAVLGAPPAVVGVVEGAAEGTASLTKLAAGPLGDRFARRPLIAAGYGMAALGKVIVAVAGAWPGVLTGRVVDRVGKGIRGAPRDALLVDGIDEASRGRVFGFHRAMDTLGAVAGPLIGLAGYELLDHEISPLLYVAIVPAVLSVALVALVRERPRPAQRVRPRRLAATLRDLPGRYWRVIVLLTAFGVVNFPDALILLRLKEIGFSVAEVILAYVGYNMVYALGSYPAGSLADRIPKPTVFGIGMVFFAAGYTGLGLTTDKVAAWLILGLYGLFTACTDGVGKAWISGLVPAELQSSAQGIFQGATGFAALSAGLWAGLLWGATGQLPLLISGIAGGFLAAVLLVVTISAWVRTKSSAASD
ncbi:MFS transporter [Mycobacterium sp. Aquia_213]|uniref:MFS transporter n=1 Tax=Mycobacterium sp. Aquia_213 TaxID=2991728 RepID=UPI0022700007|nr:MFS transporter [Mycobacterium sp. Aquia_213]WAC93777.1 MFS transporter [Mycobacterium sp. Aquia_213]